MVLTKAVYEKSRYKISFSFFSLYLQDALEIEHVSFSPSGPLVPSELHVTLNTTQHQNSLSILNYTHAYVITTKPTNKNLFNIFDRTFSALSIFNRTFHTHMHIYGHKKGPLYIHTHIFIILYSKLLHY